MGLKFLSKDIKKYCKFDLVILLKNFRKIKKKYFSIILYKNKDCLTKFV